VKKILVIEDERTIADTIVYALSTDGFEPVWCATVREGLSALRSGGFALVILDVGLPDGNGFELCKDIRKSSSVPIIFLTARASEVDRVVGLEIGADDFVPKPFSPRELAARVKAVLRRQGSTDNRAVGATPFVVDENKHSIAYFGQNIELSRYEFRLLRILVSQPGWVFSREQLMSMAWEEPEMSLDRTVDAHIKSLRAKLKAVRPDIDAILTHRGVGYSLKENW
jgi:two-component system catabolic regulation response regulator CreB